MRGMESVREGEEVASLVECWELAHDNVGFEQSLGEEEESARGGVHTEGGKELEWYIREQITVAIAEASQNWGQSSNRNPDHTE